MGTRVFAGIGNFKLISDERDIMVHKDHYEQVIAWCEQMNITATSSHMILAPTMFGVNLWRVKDDEQRLMFALRWS